MSIAKTPIAIGPDLYLHPVALHESPNVLAFGGPGAGKTTLMRVLLERAPPQFLQIIVDTEDELETLRDTGREYLILGGENADAPGLEEMPWRDLAAIVLKMGANVIFQINDWSIRKQREFIGAFVEGLLATPRDKWRPILFALDESDQYCPNGPTVDSSDALVMLAKRGRKRGWSCLFATQRIAMLSPDLRGMCPNIAIGMANQSLDVRAGAQAIGVAPASKEAKALLSLMPGEFFIGGPAFAVRPPARHRVDKSVSRAPKPGSQATPNRAGSKAILKALAALPKPKPPPAPAAQASEAPAVITREVVDVEATARAAAEASEAATAKAYAAAAKALRSLADKVEARSLNGDATPAAHKPAALLHNPPPVAHETRPMVHKSNGHPADRPPVNPTVSPPPEGLQPRHVRMLEAVAFWASIGMAAPTRQQVAAAAGTHPGNRNFQNLMGQLHAGGWVEFPQPGSVSLTATGRAAAPPQDRGSVRERLNGLLQPRHTRLVDAMPRDGRAVTRDDLAAVMGVTPANRNFQNLCGQLHGWGITCHPKPGLVAVHPWVWK